MIDNDRLVLKCFGRVLLDSGFDVVSTEQGLLVIDIYKKEHLYISIIVTDLKLKDISTKEMISRIREIDDNVKVIITSGSFHEYLDESMIPKIYHIFFKNPSIIISSSIR